MCLLKGSIVSSRNEIHEKIIAEDPDVKRNYDLVSSVMGIGLINAVNIIAYTSELPVIQHSQTIC
ncbi:hypothetical protein MASR1M46_12290 [Bacteroidales bacterium]